MKTYVLILSERFSTKHKRAGEATDFISSLEKGSKIHTIRGNYDLWKKRMDQVDDGEALISVRIGTGKPYNSKQKEICTLDSSDGIGVQEISFYDRKVYVDWKLSKFTLKEVSENDGLKLDDFQEWFKDYRSGDIMALIHFTKFRY